MGLLGLAWVAAGAAAGATLRWALAEVVPHWGWFPLPTLTANLAAVTLLSLVLGRPRSTERQQMALSIGFCGGLSTFSTVVVEMDILIGSHGWGAAVVYLTCSALLSVAAVRIVRRCWGSTPQAAQT